jgi:glycosyltransferase involved in cell wall biosynthesis
MSYDPPCGFGGRTVSALRFSIIITCYNQRQFIRDAVNSALSQNEGLREIIIVDDGSSDGSLEVLREYATSVHLVCSTNNEGAVHARNLGAARANGKYLVFLDGDDVLLPWALDVYERIITERMPKIILGRTTRFKGPVPVVQGHEVPQKIEFLQYDSLMQKDRPVGLSASSYIVDRKSFEDVGGWTPGIFYLDLQDLSTKLGFSGRMILICSPITAFYRIHAANSIHTIPPFLRMVRRLIDKERAGEYPGGREHRFERYAWFGGLLVFWTKRALKAGLYRGALKLIVSGWPMVLAAIICRSKAWIKGRQIIESIDAS